MSDSSTINPLSVSFRAKYTKYVPDLTGRDQYITVNNGGLAKIPFKPNSRSIFAPGPKPGRSQSCSLAQARAVKYTSDGSGRDFYVTCNSGGLEQTYEPGKKHPLAAFYGGLRGYPPTQRRAQLSPGQRAQQRQVCSSQRELTRRLTEENPKWKRIVKNFRKGILQGNKGEFLKRRDNFYKVFGSQKKLRAKSRSLSSQKIPQGRNYSG